MRRIDGEYNLILKLTCESSRGKTKKNLNLIENDGLKMPKVSNNNNYLEEFP